MNCLTYIVGDSEEYGIEFGEEYNYKLISLINDKLKSEGKAIIKSVDNWKEFQTTMGRLMVKKSRGYATGSELKSIETYLEGEYYPNGWQKPQLIEEK